MEKKNNNGVLVGILIGFIVALLVGICLFATETISFRTTTTNNNEQNSENNQINTNDSNNTQEETNYENYEELLEEGTTIKYTFEKNLNYVSNVKIEDTYAFSTIPETGINIFMLKEGKIYYYN